jgi:hypothetical protein
MTTQVDEKAKQSGLGLGKILGIALTSLLAAGGLIVGALLGGFVGTLVWFVLLAGNFMITLIMNLPFVMIDLAGWIIGAVTVLGGLIGAGTGLLAGLGTMGIGRLAGRFCG